jgi:hypothetical protein
MVPKADQRYSTPGVTGSVPGVVGPLLYNPAAFAAPTGLTFGNAQRNVLNSLSRTNFDVGLFKRLPSASPPPLSSARSESLKVRVEERRRAAQMLLET